MLRLCLCLSLRMCLRLLCLGLLCANDRREDRRLTESELLGKLLSAL